MGTPRPPAIPPPATGATPLHTSLLRRMAPPGTSSFRRQEGGAPSPTARLLSGSDPLGFLMSCATATGHGSLTPAPTTASSDPSSRRLWPRPRHPQPLPDKLAIVSQEIRAKHSQDRGLCHGCRRTKFFAMSSLSRANLKQVSDPPYRHSKCLELPLVNVV
jgi:hypothetical protein